MWMLVGSLMAGFDDPRRRRAGGGSVGKASLVQRSGGAPGKRTLTENLPPPRNASSAQEVQRHHANDAINRAAWEGSETASEPDAPQTGAADGVATAAESLPHQNQVVQRRADGDAMNRAAREGMHPQAIASEGVASAAASLPHHEKIQASFGRHDVSDVRAQIDGSAATAADELGASAFAIGDRVGFAQSPDLHTAAHEAAHVVQQRGGVQLAGGVDGGASDPYERHAESVAAAVVDGRSAEGLLDDAPSGTQNSGVQRRAHPAAHPGEAPGFEWAGAGKLGKAFHNTTNETFVDPVLKESCETEARWSVAEFDSYEFKTNMALELDRRIKIQLATGTVLIKSVVRTWYHADGMTNDVHAAISAPAKYVKHEGGIYVSDDKGTHIAKVIQPYVKMDEPSAEAFLALDPMLAFAIAPQERIREAHQFVTTKVPRFEANLKEIDDITDNHAPRARVALEKYIRQRMNYEDGDQQLLFVGRNLIERLTAVTQWAWTGYEGSDVLQWLHELLATFQKLLQVAETTEPPKKGALDHIADLGKAIGGALKSLGIAVKELGAMGRDLVMKGVDKAAGVFGYEVEWEPWSAVGKAYASGKSTSEIFKAVVTEMVDSWKSAIEHAENGDFSKLMDIGAALAIDVAIGEVTAGGRAGRAARAAEGGLELTEEAAVTIARRSEGVLDRAKRSIERIPAEARAALFDTIDTLEGLIVGLRESVRVADANGVMMRVVDRSAIASAIQRSRGARAIGAAKDAMKKLRGPAREQGAAVVARLEKLAKSSKMPDAIHAIARRIAEGENKAKFVAALDELLAGSARILDDEVVAGVLRRAADAIDPLAFFDNVEWVMKHRGLSPAARKGLVSQAVLRETPLDLGWLRELTDLSDEMLEFMALDPNTNWKTFMRVSTKSSERFSSKSKKALKNDAYAEANAKIRGVAGEMLFDADATELPAGFKIKSRQVEAQGKRIDYQLIDAEGKLATLEVKALTAERWATELSESARKLKPDSALERMVGQLRAAHSMSERVYLAVSDVIGEKSKFRLEQLLQREGLADVTILTFSEDKLTDMSRRLRKGLGIGT
jgi:hypothetical protein